jgi:thymidine kinase
MSLEIIVGPMFSGKSSRILSIVSRYSALKVPILVIKHSADNRYAANEVATHDNRRAPCIAVPDFDCIDKDFLARYQVIIVEEAQFFKGLIEFVQFTVDTLKKNVFLVGLDGDFHRKPFGDILNCIPMADRVDKLNALCVRCANGKEALFTFRDTTDSEQVVVGGSDMYRALCRECYHECTALQDAR